MVKGLLEIILCSKILTMNENEEEKKVKICVMNSWSKMKKKEKLNEIVT